MTISVEELFADPDFMVSLLRIRPTITVGADGITTTALATMPFVGAVAPLGGTAFFIEQGQRVAGTISIYTKTELSPGNNASIGADLVRHKNTDYTVRMVDSYTEWGPGFYVATCEAVR